MRKYYFMAAVVFASMTSVTYAENKPNTGSSSKAKATFTAAETQQATEVLSALHRTNLMEIDMGNMAESKGESKAVREYGDQLENDHKQTDKQVKDLADQMGIKLKDKDETMAESEHQKMEQLKSLKGAAFDRAFAAAMVEDHKKDIEKIEAARKTTTGALADLIDKTLPVLKRHQEIAEQLAS